MVGAPSFSNLEYWESRFQKDPSAFEWLLSPNRLDKHVLEALDAAASSSSPNPLSPQQPSIHHIGCGTSAMSFQLRRLVDDPAQVLNTDYSPAAVEIGRSREKEIFGDGGAEVVEQATRRRRGSASMESKTMRWRTIDLLSLADTAQLARDPPYPPFAVIVDKSTSDCISCVDDVAVTLPYALQPVESSTPGTTAANPPTTMAQIHPLHLLAVHLAYHTRPGGRWLAVSYSGARFPFLPPYPDRADEGMLSDETVERGFVHPGRLWRLQSHEMIDSGGDEGKGEEGGKEGGGATVVVHRPRIMHHLYVLERTDLRLEMVGR
ncbi:uncharacterized protein J3D65DRAFT_560827 [Phyllosticta citribraziliensis]|uniref:Uncharacterized protein n=1 Tax=Phyllosticta citribraziliensis TaxID=989973 RepID=A0ABR1LBC1_9PEZI